MDIGIWMSPEVLEHKLEARTGRNTLATWNTKSPPRGLGESGEPDRLFIATRGAWIGYFVLSKEALWTPEDASAPFALLFDTKSWTPITPVSVKPFRGIRVLKRGSAEAKDYTPEVNEIDSLLDPQQGPEGNK
jgi:hypothetical protein